MKKLEWKGHQVPWVTRWTGEIRQDKMDISFSKKNGIHITYTDHGEEIRDPAGILWQREGITRTGEPQFAHVSSFRQRASMLKRLCQICGKKIPEHPIRWLMATDQLSFRNGQALTTSPPTCADCVPVALQLCPHLRTKGYLIANVLEYEIWGIWGEGLVPNLETGEVTRHKRILVSYDNPKEEFDLALGGIIAKQQVVTFTKFVIEETT